LFKEAKNIRGREKSLGVWNRKVSRVLSFIFFATSATAMVACNSPDLNGTDFSAASTVTTAAPTSGSGASLQQSVPGNTLVLVSGDQQIGYPGATLLLPVVAKVLDPNGVPVVGAYVLVTVAGGGGIVSNQTPISDANGEVVFEWTLGTALTQDTLNLSVYSDLWVNGPDVTLTATRIVGGESVGNSTIVGTGPVIADGISTSHITITLLDSNNQALTGVVPTFSATGTNTYFPCTAVNAEGVSHCLMTSSQPGAKTLSVTSPIAFSSGLVQFNPGSPKFLTIAGDAGNLLSVVVKDAFNNVIPNQEIDWTVTFGGGTLSAASISTDATGTASNTYTSVSSGTQSITASVHGYPLQVPSVTFILNYGVWTFQSGTQSSAFILGNNIDFTTANVCELTPTNGPENSVAAFQAGTANGITFGTLADGVSKGFKLGASAPGMCDGSVTDCDPNAEFNASWTPEWNHILGVWHLNEPVGVPTIADSSGQGNNGTYLYNGVQGNAGKFNTGVAVYGGYSPMTVGANNFPTGASPRTISFWVNWVYSYQNPIFSYGSPGDNSSFTIYTNGGGVEYSGENGSGDFFASGGVTGGTWHHVVLTYDGTTFVFYIDGSRAGSSGGTPATVNSGIAYIGSYLGQYAATGEEIDEIAFWNTALSSAEVSTIYARQSPSHVGYFTSRVMDAFQTGANWTSLSWLPTFPFLKALPDNAISETIGNYSSLASSTLMTGIQGLWHFDEPAGTSGINSVFDKSGHGLNATPSGGTTFGNAGKFGTAVSFDNSQTGYLSVKNGFSNFTSGITISAWVNPALTENHQNERIIDFGNGAANDNIMFTFAGAGLAYWVFTGNNQSVIAINNNGLIPANVWTHALVTEDSNGLATIYVNGVPVTSGTLSVPNNITRTSNLIGKSNWNDNGFNGAIDELGIWNRVLSSAEIKQLYQRGASRVRFQVQSCAQPDCSDGTFQGPDGTSATYFSELDNSASYNKLTNAPSGSVNLTPPSLTFANFATPTPAPNRYFQYRAIFESDAATPALMPEVKSVTIAPNHYDATSPTVVGLGGVAAPVLTAFTQTLGANGCPTATYNLGIGSSASSAAWYYWNTATSAWASASGNTSQSNAATVINTNLASFPTVGTATVYFKAFLNSNGSTPCELTEVQLNGHN
jgi:hypothetical protein